MERDISWLGFICSSDHLLRSDAVVYLALVLHSESRGCCEPGWEHNTRVSGGGPGRAVECCLGALPSLG